jgi:hypothetical protein
MLRNLFQHFGSLHEAQVLQLRLWPFTVDPKLANSKAILNLEGKVVEFRWGGGAKKIDKKYQERLQELDKNVKFLLGEDWTITVMLNGALIFPVQDTIGKTSNKRRASKPKRKSTGKR